MCKELCALVFGINTFLATVLKTCITLVVSDKRGLFLDVRSQVNLGQTCFFQRKASYNLGRAFCVHLDPLRGPNPVPMAGGAMLEQDLKKV